MYSNEANEPVQIECELEWKSARGVSIKIWDGSMQPDPRNAKKRIKKCVFLPVSQIDDGNFNCDDFEVGAKMKIEIPNWLALREGLV